MTRYSQLAALYAITLHSYSQQLTRRHVQPTSSVLDARCRVTTALPRSTYICLDGLLWIVIASARKKLKGAP